MFQFHVGTPPDLKSTYYNSLPPVAPPIGDTSLTHVMRLAAHSTKSPMPTAMVTIIYNDPVVWLWF
jgi:hypothetical protein